MQGEKGRRGGGGQGRALTSRSLCNWLLQGGFKRCAFRKSSRLACRMEGMLPRSTSSMLQLAAMALQSRNTCPGCCQEVATTASSLSLSLRPKALQQADVEGWHEQIFGLRAVYKTCCSCGAAKTSVLPKVVRFLNLTPTITAGSNALFRQ